MSAGLKAGWQTWRFEQIAENINERVDDPSEAGVDIYVGLEHLDSDSLKIRRWGTPDDITSTKLRFYEGDIIFGKRRVYQRKLGVAEFDGICSAHALVLRAKPDVVLPEFLPFFMQSDLFMERAKEISVGSLSPTINWRTLAKQEFGLPGLEAQEEISKRLYAAQELKEALYEGRDNAENLIRASVLEISSAMNASWKIGDIATHITSGSRGWAKYYAESGEVFFRITNMRRGRIWADWSDTKYVHAPSTEEAIRTKVQPGDILISATAELGLVTLVTDDFPDAYMNQHVALVRPDQREVDPTFVAFYLSSPSGMRQFQRFNDHGAKAGMNLKNLANISIPRLSLDKQVEIGNQLLALDSSVLLFESRQAEHIFLQKQILNKLVGPTR